MTTVLVVDDEPILRAVVAEALRDAGYAVAEAGDGLAALDRLLAAEPDLVLMDVMMPGLDGRTAYLAMRARADLPQVPVVLMSAAVGPDELDPTVAGFLPKPFDLDELLALVGRLIGPPG